MTGSTRCAAIWAMHLAPHDEQKPRRLQLNATSLSWPQSPQRSRRKPWARMPHSRKASNSPLTNCGRSAPAAASACSKKMAACCCARRYSVVCSGRWRSQWSGAPSGALIPGLGRRPMACTRGSRGGVSDGLKPRAQPQSPCVPPTCVCSLLRGHLRGPLCSRDRPLRGDEFVTANVAEGSKAVA